MTKQNVVVSDANSGINVAITVAVSGSALYTTAAQKPPVVPRSAYITISKKKLLQNLEINSGAKIHSWVDSMRASSPTNMNASSDEHHSWIVSLIILRFFFIYSLAHTHIYTNTYIYTYDA